MHNILGIEPEAFEFESYEPEEGSYSSSAQQESPGFFETAAFESEESESDGLAAETSPVAAPPAGPLPARKRSGAPNLTNSWSRLQSVWKSPAGTGRAELEFADEFDPETWNEMDEFETGVAVPKLQVQKSLPLPAYGPAVMGPVIVTITGRITLRGSIQYGNPQTTVKLTAGEQKADFERKVFQSIGELSVTGTIEPGRASKIGVKFGTEFVDIELSAGIDFTKLFKVGVTPKQAISGIFKFGDWTFEGKIVPTLEIFITPRPGVLIAAARAVARGARLAIAIGRGLFFAGELGIATTFGAVALGIGIAVGGIAWIGLSLYLIGKAHEDGRALALGFTFNSGYASMLARLTSGEPVFEDSRAGQRTYWNRLTYDWRGALEIYRPRWVEKEDRSALRQISELGEIAALQDFALFLQIYGPEKWKQLSAHHRTKYPKETGFRRERYHQIMNRQLRDGKPVGIPLEPVP